MNRTRLRLLKPLLVRATARALAEPGDARAVVEGAFVDYELHRSEIPREQTAGGRLMVRLAFLTMSLWRTLVRRGADEDEATRLTREIAWAVYRPMGWLPGAAGRTLRGGEARLRRATRLFRTFPFGPPAYVMQDRDAPPGVVAFDVLRCAAADAFRRQGLDGLCAETWCRLDFRLARDWGGALELTGTLAGGAERCDFRWVAAGGHPEPASAAKVEGSP